MHYNSQRILVCFVLWTYAEKPSFRFGVLKLVVHVFVLIECELHHWKIRIGNRKGHLVDSHS